MDSSLPAASPDPGPPLDQATARQREQDALRIQAAAVAAQQAALTEEEARLEQRQVALDRQEKQLAAHLEEKRRQLLQLQDEVRCACDELHAQKKAYEQRVVEAANEQASERRDLAENQRQTKRERHRLLDLRRHLKQRWHRHWLAERTAMHRAEQALAAGRIKLEKEAEQLQKSHAALAQERLRLNGESELSRLQIQDASIELRREQSEWEQRLAGHKAEMKDHSRQADRRAAELVRAERELENQKRQWQTSRLHLEKEAEGLESRIRNRRRQLLDQEQEHNRLGNALRASRESFPALIAGPPRHDSTTENVALVALPFVPLAVPFAEPESEVEVGLLTRLALLERIAGDLADQRMHLAEQWQRLLRAQQYFEEQHETAAADLETLTLRLQDQEQSQLTRERDLVSGESSLRHRLAEVIHLRHGLEACQARLRARVLAWEAERNDIVSKAQTREETAERRWAMVSALQARWKKRRRLELDRVQAALAAAERLHEDYVGLRNDCLERQAALEQKERALAEQALALEQYRLECTGQSEDSPAAEKEMERLRRRWASLSVAAERTAARDRHAMQAEAERADDHYRQVQKHLREIAAREATQTEQQIAWEHEHSLRQDKYEKMVQELRTLHATRDRHERQVEDLRSEVDRVARVLLGEDDVAPMPLVNAAA